MKTQAEKQARTQAETQVSTAGKRKAQTSSASFVRQSNLRNLIARGAAAVCLGLIVGTMVGCASAPVAATTPEEEEKTKMRHLEEEIGRFPVYGRAPAGLR